MSEWFLLHVWVERPTADIDSLTIKVIKGWQGGTQKYLENVRLPPIKRQSTLFSAYSRTFAKRTFSRHVETPRLGFCHVANLLHGVRFQSPEKHAEFFLQEKKKRWAFLR